MPTFYVTQLARMHESTNCLRRNCTWATSYALKSKDVKHLSKTQRPRFAQGQPKGYFQRKELDRTTEAIVPKNEMWRKLNVNMRQYVSLRANMGQHCSLQLCRERQPFRSHMRQYVPLRANMGQHCSLSAVHRKASYEEQW